MEIYITGTGVVSAIGLNTIENLESLLRCKTGIRKLPFRDLDDRYLGEVAMRNSFIKEELGLNKRTSRTTLLAMKAAMEAWGETNSDSSIRTGVISGNSVGGMDYTEQYLLEQVLNGFTKGADTLASHPCGYSSRMIAERIGGVRYCNTISTACSSGANAILQAYQMMKNGKLDRAIAGGTDALSAFTINGFGSLMIFDHEKSRPFDANRKGLNLGEGAGYLLLETEKSLARSGNTILARLSGFGIANDSYHQTALSPEGKGAVLAMKQALRAANLEPGAIDYVNTHGTGTENNDQVELGAIIEVFKGSVPPFSSTKSYTGHTLGASGAIEAVYSVLSIVNQKVFPSLHIKDHLDPDHPATTDVMDASVEHVLSNSFGFGGNQTSLIFSSNG